MFLAFFVFYYRKVRRQMAFLLVRHFICKMQKNVTGIDRMFRYSA